ncbi:Tetratricopeptide repeat (TPR)-like superfamily protein isoform 1 [Hibiscus syriacus]|uniref:Tetratricopeptide repeat (TPR)-like superfamily protein isoform 1 n=1 Tax=Hibiscus syriacus TaxID=106335 RepID=A0A6A2W8X0_HIBSY|nr:Tetratricopeptide repeat (TPR)-like superfamily protein isoform 1 [Hibiscus syriacus]
MTSSLFYDNTMELSSNYNLDLRMITYTWIPGTPFTKSEMESYLTVSDGFDDGVFAQAKSPDIYLPTFESVGSRSLASLIKELGDSGIPIDSIIYDGFMPWELDVAKRFGIRAAVFLTQSYAANSIHYHMKLKVWELPSLVYHHGSNPAWYDVVVGQFSDIEEVDWVLVNTFYELEKEVAGWMSKFCKLGAIGPALPSMYLDKRLKNNKDYGQNLFNPNTCTCVRRLNTKPNGSVVYVSFGSMAELGAEQMTEVDWSPSYPMISTTRLKKRV